MDARLLDPICRLSGSGYAAFGEILCVQRPKWKDVGGTTGQEDAARREALIKNFTAKAAKKRPTG